MTFRDVVLDQPFKLSPCIYEMGPSLSIITTLLRAFEHPPCARPLEKLLTHISCNLNTGGIINLGKATGQRQHDGGSTMWVCFCLYLDLS